MIYVQVTDANDVPNFTTPSAITRTLATLHRLMIDTYQMLAQLYQHATNLHTIYVDVEPKASNTSSFLECLSDVEQYSMLFVLAGFDIRHVPAVAGERAQCARLRYFPR